MEKVCGYARVSTSDQAENSQALEQQQARLRNAGAELIFTDVQSGTSDRRPQFQELMQLVRDRRVERVLITRLDRLSRSRKTAFKALDDFIESGVTLQALDGSVDLGTVNGRTMAGVLVVMAQAEVEQLGERVKHGWRHLRSQKRAINPPFAYSVEDESYVINRQPFLCLGMRVVTRYDCARFLVDSFLERQTLRKALRHFNETFGTTFRPGYGMRGRLARDLMRFSPSGLYDYLTNPVLTGDTCYLKKKNGRRLPRSQWQIHRDTHEAIITRSEEREILRILASNKRMGGWGGATRFPFSGLVYCSRCNSACYALTGGTKQTPRYYYQCSKYRDGGCDQKRGVRMDVIENVTISMLVEKAVAVSDRVIELEKDADTEPESVRELRRSLDEMEKLPYNEAVEVAKESIRIQIANQLAEVKSGEAVIDEDREILVSTFSDRVFWEILPEPDKRLAIQRLVSRVDVSDGGVDGVRLKI